MEAEKRGLPNLKSTPEVLPRFIAPKNVTLFTDHQIFTETEIHSRYEILLENYCKTLHIEAMTLLEMVRKDFLPALMKYTDTITASMVAKKQVLGLSCDVEGKLATKLSGYYSDIYELTEKLDTDTVTAEGISDSLDEAFYYHETIIPTMEEIRSVADNAEELIPDDILPYPTYTKLLFSV